MRAIQLLRCFAEKVCGEPYVVLLCKEPNVVFSSKLVASCLNQAQKESAYTVAMRAAAQVVNEVASFLVALVAATHAAFLGSSLQMHDLSVPHLATAAALQATGSASHLALSILACLVST